MHTGAGGCIQRHFSQKNLGIFQLKGGGQKTPDPDWAKGRGGRSTANSRQNSPPREAAPVVREGPAAPRSRRASRVARQHSYDDEVKAAVSPGASSDTGLGLPAPMPRRASAYDVYAIPGNLSMFSYIS